MELGLQFPPASNLCAKLTVLDLSGLKHLTVEKTEQEDFINISADKKKLHIYTY